MIGIKIHPTELAVNAYTLKGCQENPENAKNIMSQCSKPFFTVSDRLIMLLP
jgi:hypothetical protein